MRENNKILNGVRYDALTVSLLLAVTIGTFLRVSLLLLYPFLALLVASFLRLRLSNPLLILLTLAMTGFLLSLFPHFFLKYNLLSLFYMLPFLLLLFADPPPVYRIRTGYTRIFIQCLAIVTAINDIIGFVQVIRNPLYDDSFIGIYSRYSISMNGLMLMNTVVFFFYFLQYIEKKKPGYLLISLFFMTSSILCYYGAGLVVCTIAFILSFFKPNMRSLLKTISFGLLAVASIYYLMRLVKPGTLDYNIANIKKLLTFDPINGPRKITSFYNYLISYPSHPQDFLLGSGPGTFNSRTAFMVGSPSYFTTIDFIKDTAQPYYFKNYAYTLWNDSNTSQALYMDGFRNQPFSSVLAFLGEYGLVFSCCFLIFYFRLYKKTTQLLAAQRQNKNSLALFRFFKFLFILLPLLLLIDNYFEYPEIMLLLLVSMKMVQVDLLASLSPQRRVINPD